MSKSSKPEVVEPRNLQEEVAKFFLTAVPWESAPFPLKQGCMIRAKELLTFLDSQGARLPEDRRLIR